MLTVLMFMTSIFWGQLADCEKPPYKIRHYSCNQPSGYRAVCAFAVLLFLAFLAFTSLIVLWRSELIDDVGIEEVNLFNDLSFTQDKNSPLVSQTAAPNSHASNSADL